jgi:hypothetical protein
MGVHAVRPVASEALQSFKPMFLPANPTVQSHKPALLVQIVGVAVQTPNIAAVAGELAAVQGPAP